MDEHAQGRFAHVVAELYERRVHVLVATSGRTAEERARFDKFAQAGVEILHLEALPKKELYREGFRRLAKSAVRNVLVMDASGPYSFGAAQHFLKLARKYPAHLLCGYSVKIDEPNRRQRVSGQRFIDLCAGICSLSFSHEDALCPMRLYPLDATLSVLTHAHPDNGNGFETELLVRLLWAGVRVRNLPVPASPDELARRADFAALAPLFAKLFALLLAQLPIIVCSRVVGWSPEASAPKAPARTAQAPSRPAAAKPVRDPRSRGAGEAAVAKARQRSEAARAQLGRSDESS